MKKYNVVSELERLIREEGLIIPPQMNGKDIVNAHSQHVPQRGTDNDALPIQQVCDDWALSKNAIFLNLTTKT